jgi:hypothetical protein
MTDSKQARSVDLKQIEKRSPSVKRFLALLRRERRDPWAARFVASGAKPPAPAPSKRVR